MAKFEMKFLDFIDSGDYIKVEIGKNKQRIDIFCESQGVSTFISLDKSTAIKLSKTLRTEINKITESEVSDGR